LNDVTGKRIVIELREINSYCNWKNISHYH